MTRARHLDRAIGEHYEMLADEWQHRRRWHAADCADNIRCIIHTIRALREALAWERIRGRWGDTPVYVEWDERLRAWWAALTRYPTVETERYIHPAPTRLAALEKLAYG